MYCIYILGYINAKRMFYILLNINTNQYRPTTASHNNAYIATCSARVFAFMCSSMPRFACALWILLVRCVVVGLKYSAVRRRCQTTDCGVNENTTLSQYTTMLGKSLRTRYSNIIIVLRENS